MVKDLQSQLKEALAQVSELQQQLSNQEARLKYFVQHAPAAMAMFDREMNYICASQKYIEVWLRGRKYQGMNHYELFPDVPERWKETHRRCLRGVTESCEEDPYQRHSGDIDYIDWITTPWYDDNHETGGLILYAEKVNERVEDKEKLLKLNEELRHSNQKLEAFLYAISQNLREPLFSCVSMAELAQSDWQDQDQMALKSRLDYLLTTARRLLATVDGFVDHASGGLNPIKLHPVDLNQVVGLVRENLHAVIEQKEALVQHPVLPVIQANEFEMLALFQHLITKGIKHSASLPPIVEIKVEEGDHLWQFQVHNNGASIPEDEQAEIFNLFRRSDEDMDDEELGIGLPLCKRIVKNMRGRIWVESAPGRGVTFFFTLPKTEK